jgi:hypothetical protein
VVHVLTQVGVYFFYDFSPIRITHTETSTPFSHFLTNLCAIAGGLFTATGIVDTLLFRSLRLAQKNEIGKAN